MSALVFDKLEEMYPSAIDSMPDNLFNTHEFMLKLVPDYQELYVQALIEYSQNDQPSLMAIEQIARGLRKRNDLIIYIRSECIENIFEQKRDFEVWRKVRK